MNLTSPKTIKELMQKYDLHFTKRFGQNFLTDQNIVEKIADASGATKEDLVIEIGPGIGTLTKALSKRADKVIAIEIDKKLEKVLEETLEENDNVKVVIEDFLKTDLDKLLEENGYKDKEFIISANLPYYITTPIIMGLLETDLKIKKMSFLIQKEVADRLAAKPGGKDYGSLSVVSQYYADISKEFDVPASVFMPKPKVDSAVVSLVIKPEEERAKVDKEKFFKVVKAAFLNRRKTLLNSLSSNLGLEKSDVRSLLESIEIDPSSRAESLNAEDYERIAQTIEKI